jgi:hypothetical protein
MLRIDTRMDGPRKILRLIGRVRYEHLDTLRQMVHNRPAPVLDLAEVNLVDVETVRFLRECQDQNIELRNSPSYIAEWTRRERAEGASGGARDEDSPIGDGEG